MPKNAQIRWDDVTVMLAVDEHGSVSAAARALQVNHATILRRIADFETRTGVRMFNKTTRGYRVSPDRRDMLDAMREASDALGIVQQLVSRARPELSGGLRITTTDSLAQFVLPTVLPDLIEGSGSPVELMVDNAHVDFARMQAHLTVRPALRLPPELTGFQCGHIRFAVYAVASGETLPWLGLSGPLARTTAAGWLRDTAPGFAAFGDSFLALAAMASAGIGRTVLPDYVGDAHPALCRLARPADLNPVPVWVGAHVDFGRSQRIRRAGQRLAERLANHPALSGET